MSRSVTRALAAIATVGTMACAYPPLEVQTIQLGKSLNVDRSIATQSTTFKPGDTVYVSVLTTARGEGTIQVKWYVGTQLLSEREKRARFQGAGATEFNMQSASGFPEGDYRVEAFIDGRSVGSRAFNVIK